MYARGNLTTQDPNVCGRGVHKQRSPRDQTTNRPRTSEESSDLPGSKESCYLSPAGKHDQVTRGIQQTANSPSHLDWLMAPNEPSFRAFPTSNPGV